MRKDNSDIQFQVGFGLLQRANRFIHVHIFRWGTEPAVVNAYYEGTENQISK